MAALQEEAEQRVANIADGDALVVWMERLLCTPPTDLMMRWMSAYADVCDRSCCYSSGCGSIRCDFCQRSFTEVLGRHLPRLECMQCQLDSPPTATESGAQTSMCEACFASADALHDHADFCHIDDHGVHTMVRRTVGWAPRSTLTPADLTHVPLQSMPDDASRSCVACMCEFDDDNADAQAVSPAACTAGHAYGMPSDEYGMVDTRGYCCRLCHFENLEVNGRTTYCDIRTCCSLCTFAREMAGWRHDFDAEAAALRAHGADAEAVKLRAAELKAVHLQPWIRAVIDAAFEA